MRVLHAVEFYHPSVGGAQEVVRQLSEGLARRGHEVHVATSLLSDRTFGELNDVQIHEFEISGNEVRGFDETPGERERYVQLLKQPFDVVMVYAAQQWTFDLMKGVLGEIESTKVLVPCGYSGLGIPAYAEYFERLPEVLSAFDACVYMSHRYQDARFAEEHRLENSVWIPNGAGDEFAEPSDGSFRAEMGIPRDVFLCLSVGNYGFAKGQDIVLRAFRRSSARNATLVFIGGRFPRASTAFGLVCRTERLVSRLAVRGLGVMFLEGLDRSRTVAAFKEADLFLFGSRLECSPLVLFEACAAGVPFISTSCGNASEVADWTSGGVVVTGVRPMAEAISALASNPEQGGRLSRNGRNAWEQNFRWETIVGRYEALYSALLADKSPHATLISSEEANDGEDRP